MDEPSTELELLDLDIMYPNEMLLDYLHNKKPLSTYFHAQSGKLHDVKFSGRRSILKEVLLEYNKSINAHDNVIANIEQLENDNVKVVVTGQQPGLFTGPMYTIFKTMSAINYAKYYSTHNLKLIPLFWNASEDHDVEEVNNIRILNKENEVVPVKAEIDDMTVGKSLEGVTLQKDKFTNIISDMITSLPETEFSADVKKLLENELNHSTYWGEYFSRILSRLMANYGLIIIEPKIFRPYLKGFYQKLMNEPIHYNNIFLKSTDELSKIGYKPKMHKKENISGLFYIDNENNRNTITISDKGEYELSNGIIFSKEEIFNEIMQSPQKFSTNAIFRPLAQDTMIPTYIFIGGPSEIGYHLQIKDLYKEFHLTQPNLMFRMGATVIERHINRIIEKYNFKITELKDLNQLTSRLLASENDQILQGYFSKISSTFDEMNNELEKYNKELGNRVLGRRNTIMKELDNIEKMYMRYVKNDNQVMISQLEKAKAFLFPDNKPQERMFNIFQYINKYSFNLMECMRNLLSKNQPSKHVVLKCWMF